MTEVLVVGAGPVGLTMAAELAGDPLLSSYEDERRPVGADVVARTTAASLSFGQRGGKTERLENTQILVNYRGGAIVEDRNPAADAPLRAGDRAPDASGLRRADVGFPLRLFDMLRGIEHVLLVYLDGAGAAAAAAAVETLAAGLKAESRIPIRVVAIAAAATHLPEPVGYALLRDAGETFAKAYGAKPGMTLLVRPDGYIGLADVAPGLETIASFLRRY